ncbi:unnamed protein product, partial [Laminaria digitata]
MLLSRRKKCNTRHSTTSDDEKSRPLPCLACNRVLERDYAKLVLLILFEGFTSILSFVGF